MRGADREIIHTHQLANKSADRLGLGRELQPFVECAAFVGFKMTPGNVLELHGINQRGHGLPQFREHRLQSRVKKQGFLVPHEEVVELHVKVRDVNREPKKIGGDLVDRGHG